MASHALEIADVRAEFPEFASTADSAVARAIRLASQVTNVSRDARLYCAAHFLTKFAEETGKQHGGSGLVEREVLDDREVWYVTTAKKEADVFFSTSAYGDTYLTLARHAPRRVVSIVVA